MEWSFDWTIFGQAITGLIHYIGKTITIIVETIKLSF